MSPKPSKFHLLLDEMMPKRQNFPQLNKFHNLRHIVHDYKLGGVEDKKVVQLAHKEKRILISKNEKHFVDLCKRESVKLICVTETMTWEEIDNRIVAILRKTKPTDLLVKISRPIRKQR